MLFISSLWKLNELLFHRGRRREGEPNRQFCPSSGSRMADWHHNLYRHTSRHYKQACKGVFGIYLSIRGQFFIRNQWFFLDCTVCRSCILTLGTSLRRRFWNVAKLTFPWSTIFGLYGLSITHLDTRNKHTKAFLKCVKLTIPWEVRGQFFIWYRHASWHLKQACKFQILRI